MVFIQSGFSVGQYSVSVGGRFPLSSLMQKGRNMGKIPVMSVLTVLSTSGTVGPREDCDRAFTLKASGF